MRSLDVLIVEDDPMVVEIHRRCIQQVPGYRVVAAAGTGEKALELLERIPVDLLILDIFMPGLGGIDTLRILRERGIPLDVVVVSAANDVTTVHEVMRGGAFDYIVKPFRFERMHETLCSYRAMREKLKSREEAYRQEEIDSLYRMKNAPFHQLGELPKGLSSGTMEHLLEVLKGRETPMAAEDIAREAGIARVTARRYLEYLVGAGKVSLQREYQEVGRPKNLYRLQ